MDMEGDCKSTGTLGDARLSVPSNRPIRILFKRSIPSRIKRMMQQRRGLATRVRRRRGLAQKASSKSPDALHGLKLSVPMSTTAVEISEYVTASESMPSSSSTEIGSGSTSASEPSPTNFVSKRIERLMQVRSEYASAVEFEIEASKVHWSELDNPTSDDDEENSETDMESFESLRKKWGGFFKQYGDRLVVGEKIAEGGQAEIFNADCQSLDGRMRRSVVKVFKEGYALRDLQKQWPLSMLESRRFMSTNPGLYKYWSANSCAIYGATLLKNGRFAFHMEKYWGDLRKLIDLKMQHNQNQLPPFPKLQEGRILVQIALGMRELHKHCIIHRDLKTSNVLICEMDNMAFDPIHDRFHCLLGDYECSVGVVGTGYWRAPEILYAIQTGNIKSHVFTEKSDVYSFGMTCYEVLTGCIPFEDLGGTCYDFVIKGNMPELPDHIDPSMKRLLSRCWNTDPHSRPSFRYIIKPLEEIYGL